MTDDTDRRAIRLTIFGKGIEVEKMQKCQAAISATCTSASQNYRVRKIENVSIHRMKV